MRHPGGRPSGRGGGGQPAVGCWPQLLRRGGTSHLGASAGVSASVTNRARDLDGARMHWLQVGEKGLAVECSLPRGPR